MVHRRRDTSSRASIVATCHVPDMNGVENGGGTLHRSFGADQPRKRSDIEQCFVLMCKRLFHPAWRTFLRRRLPVR